MASFTFDDFARTTLGAATNRADGSPLSASQIDNLIGYLKSAGSGPDTATSYAEYLDAKMRALPPELPPGIDYVGYSGTDSGGISNYRNATTYKDDLSKKAGIIGDTPWGDFIKDLDEHPARHPEFTVMEGKLQRFMDAHGVEPYGRNYSGALQDMMWNAGSPQYFENAIATGKPLVAFVENAPANRGFSNFELTTALEHPHVRINGYPVSAFGPEPLVFVSNSAAEYQALERAIAQDAATNSGQPVTVAEVRAQLKPIDGYDAVNRTLFSRPLNEFKALTLSEMSHARADWIASRAGLPSGPRLYADVAEPLPHGSSQPGAPRGPPGSVVNAAEVGADSAPRGAGAGVSPGMKVAGVAGVALLAHDFATSGHKWVTLNSQGNAAGADSTAAHFVGRNVGGALGGFGAGASVGLGTGSWTGPGALLVGLGGGVLGAYLGETWADQKDVERIYTQVDPLGRTWTRDPADTGGRWLRASYQQRVQSSDIGNGVEVRPVQTAQGDDVTFRASYVATGALERQLNWQAARASYELGLANPPPPQDPYRLSVSGEDSASRGAFETARSFVRDPLSRQWELEIKEMVDGRVPNIRHELVSTERAQALDEQSRTVIAQNAANTPAAMAARYMVAHAQERWSDFGDKDNPSIPSAILEAQRSANTVRASDGNSYTRQDDGHWISKGVIYQSAANRNVSEELDVTWHSQTSGVAGLNALAEEIKANMQVAREGVHGQVAALYERYGIERTEEQLNATAAAVEQNLSSTERRGDLVLELIPDPRTHAASAESAIAAFGDSGGNRMVLTATTTMEDVAKIQSLHQQPASLQFTRENPQVPTLETVTVGPGAESPVPDSPELRITALSALERDAHEQALREANREGLSIREAQQVAAAAALGVAAQRIDEALAPEAQQRESGPVEATVPQAMAAAAIPPISAPLPTEPDNARPSEMDRQDEARRTEAERAQASRETEEADRRHAVDTADEVAREVPQAQTNHPEAPEAPPMYPAGSGAPDAMNLQPAHAEPGVAMPAAQEAQREPEPEPVTIANTHQPAPQITEPPPIADQLASDRHPANEGHREQMQSLAEEAIPPQHFTQPSTEAEQEQAAQPPVFNREESYAQDSLLRQPEQPEQPEQPISSEPEREELADTPPAELLDVARLPGQQHAAPAKLSPTHPGHPDHRLYEQIREGVVELDARHGRTPDAMSERLTGSLLVLAKDNGLDRVDHVVLSQATADARSGQNVFVVQGEMGDPAQLRAGMSTQQAVSTPWEESMQQFDAVAEERQARGQQQASQQQDEDQRVQHEMQIAAASVGG